MGKVSLLLALLPLSLLSGAQEPITQDCNFASTPTNEIVVSDMVGGNVCIKRADTDPALVNVWHNIACPDSNMFRSSGDTGNAILCRTNVSGKAGIGVDFTDLASVRSLDLVCENSTGTTTQVIAFTVFIRDVNSIVFLPQSGGGIVGETIVIAKFVGLSANLGSIQAPPEVVCNTNTDADNCRFASDNSESELTTTCTYTSQTVSNKEFVFIRNDTNETLARFTVEVRSNDTEATPTAAPPVLGVGEIVGIGLGVLGIVILIVIVALVIAIIVVWCVGPGPKRSDPERGEMSTPHYDYVAFGRDIPAKVMKAILTQFNAEEYKLNGMSVEEKFGEGNDRVLCVTTSSEYSEPPSADAHPSLTAQMRHFETTWPGGRVRVVEIPDEKLREVDGAQDTDGVSPVVGLVNERVQHQPADRPSLLRLTSTDRVLATITTQLQSIHRMLFNSRVEEAQAETTDNVTGSASSFSGEAISEVNRTPPPMHINGQVNSEAEQDL